METALVNVFLPSDSDGLGGAVTGDDGDEAWVVCVLQGNTNTSLNTTGQHL